MRLADLGQESSVCSKVVKTKISEWRTHKLLHWISNVRPKYFVKPSFCSGTRLLIIREGQVVQGAEACTRLNKSATRAKDSPLHRERQESLTSKALRVLESLRKFLDSGQLLRDCAVASLCSAIAKLSVHPGATVLRERRARKTRQSPCCPSFIFSGVQTVAAWLVCSPGEDRWQTRRDNCQCAQHVHRISAACPDTLAGYDAHAGSRSNVHCFTTWLLCR